MIDEDFEQIADLAAEAKFDGNLDAFNKGREAAYRETAHSDLEAYRHGFNAGQHFYADDYRRGFSDGHSAGYLDASDDVKWAMDQRADTTIERFCLISAVVILVSLVAYLLTMHV